MPRECRRPFTPQKFQRMQLQDYQQRQLILTQRLGDHTYHHLHIPRAPSCCPLKSRLYHSGRKAFKHLLVPRPRTVPTILTDITTVEGSIGNLQVSSAQAGFCDLGGGGDRKLIEEPRISNVDHGGLRGTEGRR